MNKVSGAVSLSKPELEKIARFLSESGKIVKQATQISENLLADNERLAEELNKIKAEKIAAERTNTVTKIAGALYKQGFISKAHLPQKIAELNQMTDEALNQFYDTVDGLNGTPAEKKAAEGTFNTFSFMSVSDCDVVSSDGKPKPLSFD